MAMPIGLCGDTTVAMRPWQSVTLWLFGAGTGAGGGAGGGRRCLCMAMTVWLCGDVAMWHAVMWLCGDVEESGCTGAGGGVAGGAAAAAPARCPPP
eukprot:3941013-Rhodomonas_salina.2